MKTSFDAEMAYAIELGPTVPCPGTLDAEEKEYVQPVVGERISVFNPFGPESSLLPLMLLVPLAGLLKLAVPLLYDTSVVGASPPRKNDPEIDDVPKALPTCLST